MTDVVFDIIKGREAMETALMKTTALERYGKPEEVSAHITKIFFVYKLTSTYLNQVAALVTFLAGPGGSYITGQDIKVDGGISAAVPYSPFFGEN